jgi:purine nucleoside permease
MRRRKRRTLVSGSLAAGLLITLLGSVAPAGGADSAFGVDTLILTTFDGEQEPFLRHHQWDRTFPAADGEFAPIHCRTTDHVCVTMTGTTKSKAGPSTMALLGDPRLRLDHHSLFIVAGIAGIRSRAGTLGTGRLADWIVDVDLGTHFVDRRQAPPQGWLPFDAYDQAAYRLNAELVTRAYQATSQLTLADDPTAEAERRHYGAAEVAEPPRVQRCDTAGSDGFWVGADWADKADHILRERITAVDPGYRGYRCSSELEDPAIAGALKRLGLLDRLLVVRSASDFEDQRPGSSPRALYELLHSPDGFAGYNIARENAYRVAWQLTHNL